jgi:hypothetical protein
MILTRKMQATHCKRQLRLQKVFLAEAPVLTELESFGSPELRGSVSTPV